MPASNAILPFGTGAGANVLTDAAYAALTARSTGYQAGVATSAQLNKTWRQAAFVAAMIGQFTADYSGQNTVDDGNIPTFEANFVLAVRSLSVYTGIYFGRDTGTANLMLVAPATAATSYFDGMVVSLIKGSAANSAVDPTINVSSLGARVVKKENGGQLLPGDLLANVEMFLVYDATGGFFRKIGRVPSDTLDTDIWHYGVAAGSATVVTTTLTHPVQAGATNFFIALKVGTTNTGATTLDFGFGAKPIVVNETAAALVGGEMVAGSIADLFYDGTNLRLISSLSSIIKAFQTGVKKTKFSASSTGGLANGGYVAMSFTDASTADFTNNGSSGFTVVTPGLYNIEASGVVSPNITGSATAVNSYGVSIWINGTLVDIGENYLTSVGAGSWAQVCSCDTVVFLNAGDVVLPYASVTVTAGYSGSGSQWRNARLQLVKIF